MQRAETRKGLGGRHQTHVRTRLALGQPGRKESYYQKRNVKKANGLERLRAGSIE
jgi:hypothetical protein